MSPAAITFFFLVSAALSEFVDTTGILPPKVFCFRRGTNDVVVRDDCELKIYQSSCGWPSNTATDTDIVQWYAENLWNGIVPETEVFLLPADTVTEYCCLAGDLMTITSTLSAANGQCPPTQAQNQQREQPQQRSESFDRLDNQTHIPEPEPRILFGQRTPLYADRPYMAFINVGCYIDEQPINFGGCSAAFVSSRHLISAAHCFFHLNVLLRRCDLYREHARLYTGLGQRLPILGNSRVPLDNTFVVSSTDKLEEHQKRPIYRVSTPSSYDIDKKPIKANDLAIIELMEDVPGIIPISVGVIRLEHVSDELLLFLGYGRTAGEFAPGKNQLMAKPNRFLREDVIEGGSHCRTDVPGLLCYNHQHRRIQIGDSGGPLVLQKNGRPYAIGVSHATSETEMFFTQPQCDFILEQTQTTRDRVNPAKQARCEAL